MGRRGGGGGVLFREREVTLLLKNEARAETTTTTTEEVHWLEMLYGVAKCSSSSLRDGDAAQLLRATTGTPLTQVRFPGAAREFSSQCQLSVQTLFRCPHTPVCNSMH